MIEDKQKIALVTGGSSGIGYAIVERLLISGYRVAYCGRTEENVATSHEHLKSVFGEEHFVSRALDLAKPEDLVGFMSDVCDKWGPLSVVINNAGVSPKRDGKRVPLHEISEDEWNQTMAVNLSSAFRSSQLVLPDMVALGYGRIVFVGSMATRTLPKLAGASYVVSKSALSGLMRSIVSEYSEYGITANIVAPGNVKTKMIANLDESALQKVKGRVPLNRLGSPGDIAGIICFLCSSDGAFINGATIDVNGGELISP